MGAWGARRWLFWIAAPMGATWLVLLAEAPTAGAAFGCGVNPFCVAGKGVTAIVGGVAGDVVSAVAHAVFTAVGQMVATVATLWVHVPTPDLVASGCDPSTGPCQPSDTVGFLQSDLKWLTVAVAAVSLGVGASRMVIDARRGEQAGRELLGGLLRFVILSGLGATLIWMLVQVGDSFSTWILSQSLQCVTVNGARSCSDFGANMTVLLGFSTATAVSLGWGMLLILLGLVAILASVIQVLLMYMRGGLLVLFAGLIPLVAANWTSEMGKHQYKRGIAWTTAAVLYKPAAAVVYAAAFRLAGQNVFAGGGAIGSVLAGLMMMILAVVALPALVRFVAPVTAAVAGGGMAGILGAGAGYAALRSSLPTGAAGDGSVEAALLSGDRGGGGGGGPGGADTIGGGGGPLPPAGGGSPNGGSRNGGGGGGGGGSSGGGGGAASGGGANGGPAAVPVGNGNGSGVAGAPAGGGSGQAGSGGGTAGAGAAAAVSPEAAGAAMMRSLHATLTGGAVHGAIDGLAGQADEQEGPRGAGE